MVKTDSKQTASQENKMCEKEMERERETSTKTTSLGILDFNYSTKIDAIMIVDTSSIHPEKRQRVENWNLMKLNTEWVIKGNKSPVERNVSMIEN